MSIEIYEGVPSALYEGVVQDLNESQQEIRDLKAALCRKNNIILAQNKAISILQKLLEDTETIWVE